MTTMPTSTRPTTPAFYDRPVSQSGEQRSSRVESLRALAALAVLLGHVAGIAYGLAVALPGQSGVGAFQKLLYGGGFGVLFFFALTGYLLFWPFAKAYFGGGDSIDLGRYAANRALRILPLYYAVVVVVLLFQSDDAGLGIWLRFVTFTENFDTATAGQFVGTAWSLVVEIEFYVLLPLLAIGIGRLAKGSISRAAVLLAALAALSLVVRVVTVYAADPVNPLWRFSLPATFYFFVPGMLLALVRIAWQSRRPNWLTGLVQRSDLWLAAGPILWLVVALDHYNLDFLLGPASFLIAGACVLPLAAGPVTRAIEWRPLALVGVASYSLYLWHVPVLEALVDAGLPTGLAQLALVGIPVSIGVALLSYRVIESPFLRLRRQWARSSAPQTMHPASASATQPATADKGA
jgi:peptidoglycan/LPS O-acetylase OafA/YrhL